MSAGSPLVTSPLAREVGIANAIPGGEAAASGFEQRPSGGAPPPVADAPTSPSSGELSFDQHRLIAYLRGHLDGLGGEVAIEKLAGGQSNPTFVIRVDGVRRYVLRKQPDGPLLPSAHAVDREYRVMKALAGSDVPVPTMRLLCDDRSVIGTLFFVMDFADGRSFWDPTLPELAPAERGALYDDMNRVLAALHAIDPASVGLGDFGRPGNYFGRQIARWTKQYRASQTRRIDSMENLIDWLPAHIPAGDETSLVHGDFRLDNLIIHKTEPRIVAVLDWELSTLGHPLADFAYHMLAWRFRPDEFRGMAGADLAALGIPDETAYVAAYRRRTGRAGIAAADWRFALAYNMFRLAAIRQGIMRRVLDGNATNENAASVGSRAGEMADAGWALAETIKTA